MEKTGKTNNSCGLNFGVPRQQISVKVNECFLANPPRGSGLPGKKHGFSLCQISNDFLFSRWFRKLRTLTQLFTYCVPNPACVKSSEIRWIRTFCFPASNYIAIAWDTTWDTKNLDRTTIRDGDQSGPTKTA